jgi:hypothetical protein
MIRVLPLLALFLAACAGPVAPDAPALLSVQDLAARAAVAGTDPTRGTRAASDLTSRAAALSSRAAALRRASPAQDDRADLLRRAEALATR